MSIRQAVLYAELDIDWCQLRFGETTEAGTCTATIGEASPAKCFNTIATCPVREVFDPAPVTLRFAEPQDYLSKSIRAIQSIVSVDFTLARLEPGESLGTRGTVRIQFREHPYPDTGPGFDKYVTERPYSAYGQGSFWSKFRARQPFLRSEPLRLIMGFADQALAEMETRHYFVDSFDGPTPDGLYTLIAKDPLKYLDGDRANAPRPNKGYLSADIAADATGATLAPAGIGDEDYEASGLLSIGGKETIEFTRSGDTLSFVERGLYGTEPQAHKGEDRVQVGLLVDAKNPAEIVDLLTTGYVPGWDADWNPVDDWEDEVTEYLRREYTRFIPEPTPVNQLIDELIVQAGLCIGWDDLRAEVFLQVLRQIPTDAAVYDDRINVVDTLRIREQQSRRVSEVWMRYAQRNPLEGQTTDNFPGFQVGADPENEENYGQPAIRKVWGTWLPLGASSAANRCIDLIIGRYGKPPREFAWSLFRGTQEPPEIGGGYQLAARGLQDASGAAELVPVQIVEIKPLKHGWDVVAIEMRYTKRASDDVANKSISFNVNQNGINLRTVHDTLFPDPVDGDTINAFIPEGVILGAAALGAPAFTIGSWPTLSFTGTRTDGSATILVDDTSEFAVGMPVGGPGLVDYPRIVSIDPDTSITLDDEAQADGATTLVLYTIIINLYARGRGQGPGGRGGRGASWNPTQNPSNGEAGGTALYLRYPINLFLDVGAAEIWAGGSGGGGADVLNLDQARGGGGGGGAGIPGGPGGDGPGNAQDGGTGSQDAAGPGGNSYASFNWWTGPNSSGVYGGPGGPPGGVGSAGGHHGGNADEQQPGQGGPQGAAIDGASYAKKTGSGDIRGTQIN